MTLSPPQALGLVVVAVAMLIVFAIVLRRQPRRIWLFALALLAVGLGYLATTPAPTEIARLIFGHQY
ncbi:MAG TPA: hypothetical protein VMX97_11630 [Hyphomicrobiaceae bacterium]|nr:hypothetical protein [Hyphomicrobiaceae bacterium]